VVTVQEPVVLLILLFAEANAAFAVLNAAVIELFCVKLVADAVLAAAKAEFAYDAAELAT